jgi:YfiH family protein
VEPAAHASTIAHRSPLLAGVPHGFSTRHGGVSQDPFATLNLGMSTADEFDNVVTNRRIFAADVGVEWDTVIAGRLTHGDSVSVFSRDDLDRQPVHDSPIRDRVDRELTFHSDAVVSDVPGSAFFITFADCVPLMYWDPVRQVIAAAHAGWRGTALGIAATTVHTMSRAFGTKPQDLRVAIGPSIGPCCYQVGGDVTNAFEASGEHPQLLGVGGAMHLDLWATNRLQLEESGVPVDAIDTLGLCTACRVDDFFSHRRERGRTGRAGLLVALPRT